MTTQAGIPTEKSTDHTKQRTRTRSGSLLKVEEVGEGSAEQDLDQNLYVNINADWVNMKGRRDPPPTTSAGSHKLPQALGLFTLCSSSVARS